MRRSLRAAVAAGALGAGLAVALILAQSTSRAAAPHSTPHSTAATGTFTEFALPTANKVPESIVSGPDGNLWFTESQAGGAIGRITPTGTVTEFGITTANSGPFWITAGPDGNLWFTESYGNKIGKITTSGTVTEFTVPTANSGPNNIVAGPDGNLWFTEFAGDTVGKISTAGTLTEVAHLTAGAAPAGIVVGSDGNLWFDEQNANKIGRITTAGTVTEFVLAAGRTPSEIAAGPDGNLWFTEFDGNRIGKITTAGSVTEFAVPTASSQPGSIAVGIDGNLWFTEQNGNKVGRITSDGTITEFGPIPTAASGPGGINPGPDGNLWFTERLGNKIGRLTMSCDIWLGTVDGNFGTAGNWSTGAVPTMVDDVCITATTKTGPAATSDTYTILLNGTFSIHSLALGGPNGTQTLVIPANNVELDLGPASTVNANGVLTLGSTGTGYSLLCCAGATLTNSGHLNITPVATGGASRYVRSNLVNAAGGTVDIAGYTLEDAYNGATTTINNGSFTVEGSGSLVLTPGASDFASFTNAGGSVTNNGTFSESGGRFTQRGGTESGNAVVLTGGATLDDDTSAGAARFAVTGASLASITLTGTGPNPGVAAGQVVTIAGSNAGVKVLVSLTNAGTIVVGDNSGSGYSLLTEDQNGSVILTNTGHLNFVPGGLRYLRINLVNAAGGTVDVAAADTRQDGNNNGSPPNGPVTTTTNNGTFTVEAGAVYVISGGSSFANGGAVTNNGAFSLTAGKFTQRGTESGNAIVIADNSTLDDDLSAGAGQFKLTTGFSYGDTLMGSGPNPGIAAGQVVTLASNDPAHPHDYTVATNFTNAGTINMGDGSNTGPSVLANAAPVTLTNTGRMNTIVGGGGYRYLRLNVTNAATGAFDIAATTVMDLSGRTFTNHGTLTLETTGMLALGNGAAFAQDAAGTFATTIDANGTKFGQLNGGGDTVTLDGMLKVTTVGKPAVGSSWPIISNAIRAGTFANHDFGYWNYDLQYPATGVTLVAQNTCDVWIGGVDSNFGTAANWSLGFVPTSTDDACINATTTTIVKANADTYSVLVNGVFSVHSLTLGGPNGTQTLNNAAGGSLSLLASSSVNAHGALIVGSSAIFKMADVTSAGTITLGDAASGDTGLGCSGGCSPSGPTLTNNGTLKTIQGGGGIRHIQVMVVNAVGATLDVAGTAVQTDAGCNSPGGISNNRAIINNGGVTVEANADFSPSCGFVNNAGATVANNGVFRMSGDLFVQRGSESGNPVTFTSGSGIDDDLSAGPGSFVFTGGSAPGQFNSLGGYGPHPGIPVGQTITIASTNTYIGIFPNMTNAGTIILGDNSGTGDSGLCCAYFTSGATITNTGTIKTVQGSGGIRHLEVNVANAAGGIIDIGTDTRQDQVCGTGGINATTITNAGTFTLEATGHYTMGNCPAGGYQNTFTQGAGGTFQTTVDANATKFGQLTGGTVKLDGNLGVTTVGWPSLDSTWPIISGAIRSGTFTTSNMCGPDYNVEYAPTSVTLAVRATFHTTQITAQKWLTNSDGATWIEMDPGQLSLTFTPSADSYAILSGNADLWTSVAGYNQDLGISVSGGGPTPGPGVYPSVASQPEAWKESGGFAGTFSPNAAFVQTVVFLKQGQQYTVTLVWKANKSASGATIWAGAGPIGTQYSPTRLTARLLPASTTNLKSATITNQATQSASNGATWKDLDPGLSFQYTPCVNGMAVLSGNVDLWTSVRGFNQDVGISVSGGTAYPTKPGQPEAWKESGGFAGTFSPNAAFVQTVIPLNANTTYTIKLSWKANKQSPVSAAIWAGAGPIGNQYSPSRLLLQFVPSTGGPPSVLDAPSTTQYSQSGSNGSTWKDIDLTSATPLTLQVKSATSCTAIVSANADLWTDTGGYNQDIGITVSGGGYPTIPLQPEAWKESGGSAGTYSPNAAFVQVVLPLLANAQYTVSLQWKSNLPMPSTARIWTGAGPIGSDYSPTRLTVQLLGCT